LELELLLLPLYLLSSVIGIPSRVIQRFVLLGHKISHDISSLIRVLHKFLAYGVIRLVLLGNVVFNSEESSFLQEGLRVLNQLSPIIDRVSLVLRDLSFVLDQQVDFGLDFGLDLLLGFLDVFQLLLELFGLLVTESLDFQLEFLLQSGLFLQLELEVLEVRGESDLSLLLDSHSERFVNLDLEGAEVVLEIVVDFVGGSESYELTHFVIDLLQTDHLVVEFRG
jgi:hypothetical protein